MQSVLLTDGCLLFALTLYRRLAYLWLHLERLICCGACFCVLFRGVVVDVSAFRFREGFLPGGSGTSSATSSSETFSDDTGFLARTLFATAPLTSGSLSTAAGCCLLRAVFALDPAVLLFLPRETFCTVGLSMPEIFSTASSTDTCS